MTEYRCTRNFPYPEDDPDNLEHLSFRQGHYIHAESEEEAWQQMAIRYPEETAVGFAIQDWSERSGKSVTILRVKRDKAGNEILINQEGNKTTTNGNDIVDREESEG